MKKYKLKQWYPSLALTWSTEDRYEYDASRQVMVNISNVKKEVVIPQRIVVKEYELHPDFWEVVKEPLFVTEDGADVCRGVKTWAVDINTFKKAGSGIHNGQAPNYKYFIHESNADEYILLNKPFLSINDISDLIDINEESIDIDTDIYDKLKQLAKERSKQ